jgi:hypothetical protein
MQLAVWIGPRRVGSRRRDGAVGLGHASLGCTVAVKNNKLFFKLCKLLNNILLLDNNVWLYNRHSTDHGHAACLDHRQFERGGELASKCSLELLDGYAVQIPHVRTACSKLRTVIHAGHVIY